MMTDINDYAAINQVYAEFFLPAGSSDSSVDQTPLPARSAFAVKALPAQALVEIEAVVVL